VSASWERVKIKSGYCPRNCLVVRHRPAIARFDSQQTAQSISARTVSAP
jgi:hypothetical protein